MSPLAVVAGVLVYPVTVGLAARLWVWLLGWDIAHDAAWRHKGFVTRSCGWYDAIYDTQRLCPGCSRRQAVWVLAALWPGAIPGFFVGRTALRTWRVATRSARTIGPKTYTGDPQ